MPGVGFQAEWMDDPTLNEWIVRVANSNDHVYCRFCQQLYRAHKNDLNKHLEREKHKRNVIEKKNKPGFSGSFLDVSFVVRVDSNGNQMVSEEGDNSGINATSKQSYSYCKHWEENPLLKDWLRPAKDNNTKAYCEPCDLLMCAKLSGLKSHAKTIGHTTNVEHLGITTTGAMCCNQEYNRNVEGSQSVSQMDSGEIGYEGDVLGLRDVSDDECEVKHIISDKQEEDEIMKGEINDVADTNDSFFLPKRRKIDHGSVLESIADGEFIDCELMEIAKAALGKISKT